MLVNKYLLPWFLNEAKLEKPIVQANQKPGLNIPVN